MSKKIATLIILVITSTLLASVYGILHNQISYSISSEYFTKFTFYQIGKWLFQITNERIAIAIVGIITTWWFGLLIGFVLGIIALIQSDTKTMWKNGISAILKTLIIAIVTGFIGLLVGIFIITKLDIQWNLPEGLLDQNSFLVAATIHNFSYLGGVIGLVYGIVFLLKNKTNIK